MEKYRKTVIIRVILLSALALFAVGLGIYDVFRAADEVRSSEIFAFQCGLRTALGILAIVMIFGTAGRCEAKMRSKSNATRKTTIG